MTLLEECIIALGNDTEILSSQETKITFQDMSNTFPMTKWGRIDWEKTDGNFEIVSKKIFWNDLVECIMILIRRCIFYGMKYHCQQ